ncbi:MAG: DUF4421 domain-containing protein [Bacteroidales bacterium]|nr:DUF4421 domain-containing protein [Bacteroidales bacterium]
MKRFRNVRLMVFFLALMPWMPAVLCAGGDTLNTTYVEDLSHRLSVRVYGINKYNRFSLYDKTGNSRIMYGPNERFNLGLGVNYRWFGIGLAFNLPLINNDDDIYGKTDRFDFQLNVFTRKLIIDTYLQYYKGFYIENPETLFDQWTDGMPYPQRPDIFTSALGTSFIYVFNHKKYSSRAAFVQTELQKKSAGSFVAGAYLSLFSAAGDSGYIPAHLSELFSGRLNISGATVSNLGISFGYAHTFVIWKKLYISLAFVPGISVQAYSVDRPGDSEPENSSGVALKSIGRLAIVRNADRSFFGISFNGDNFSMSRTGEDIQDQFTYSIGATRVFYGRRFAGRGRGEEKVESRK